jgi:hypothetical protein
MSDRILAAIVTVANCPGDCPCQSVHVEFLHEDSSCFASIPLSPEGARRMAADLLGAADIAEAQKAKIEGRVQ